MPADDLDLLAELEDPEEQPGYRAGYAAGVRAGREQAAAAIRERAERIAVDDPEPARRTLRRHLGQAARIAAGPMTMAEAAQALAAAVRDGTLVACMLDDAGRAIPPHTPAAPAVRDAGGTIGTGEGDPVGAASVDAQRPSEAVRHGVGWMGRISFGQYEAKCHCGYIAHGPVFLLAARHLDEHLTSEEADRG